ncbi:MAG: diaminopimelate epimerase [Haloarculaceae archaeon]
MVDVEKYHGTGNDFVVVDATEDVPDRRAFARALCDRGRGISHPDSDRVGADGVLFLSLEDEYDPPRVVMTLVQPDGSVAAMCGNGARCAAAWVHDRTGARDVMIDTQAGTRRATVEDDGTITLEMGTPTFAPGAVPVRSSGPLIEREVEGLVVTAVNTGVPHAVAFVDDVAAVDVEAVAPPVRHASVFPEGANVTFASRDGEGFRQRTFERGVEGETDSCGTGAVAVVAAATELGTAERGVSVPVSPPGGDLAVTLTANGEALLRGPALCEFATDVPARRPA